MKQKLTGKSETNTLELEAKEEAKEEARVLMQLQTEAKARAARSLLQAKLRNNRSK